MDGVFPFSPANSDSIFSVRFYPREYRRQLTDIKRRKAENRELMAEHTNSELSYGGASADPNVAPAIENEEAEQAPAAGDDRVNFENSLSLADNSGQSEQPSNSADIPDNIQNRNNFFLELQEANNISKAAYKELTTIAVEAKTWVVATPALGSLDEYVQMFRGPPLPGKRVHCSTHSEVVRIHPDHLVSIMMDADKWASSLSHIVSRKSVPIPPAVFLELGTFDRTIKSMVLVDTEFQLPTPLFRPTKFGFWRCLREIVPDVWAILDISRDYFPGAFVSESENMCRKRPSGLFVRRNGDRSEVIWIENVEIPEAQSKNGIYSGLIDSNSAFSAKRWVDALRWKLKRKESRFSITKMEVNETAGICLLNITGNMRRAYLDIVSETPADERWVTLSYKDVRILRNSAYPADSVVRNYVAVASFRLQAKPISVIDFLVKKNMDIQWPRLLNVGEPEEMIRLTSGRNCITIHRRVVFQDGIAQVPIAQDVEYLLQETSRDGFCFFVTSTPISKAHANMLLLIGAGTVSVRPSGFALMPDGTDGFNSDASLVTVAIQQQLNVPNPDQAIPIMCDLVNGIIKDISEEVSKLSDTSS
ncbi:homeobox-leucine zipper protein ROC1-like [Rhododendron vialii]|uniref:homeobox-leucine zipper protein ROC1-like n=1 Tax=Rhododendron vialii TaxID=182163 RepID=UPI0026604A09|nr:homeobox-leucine zipper protein ROC1-like [Rhododendron vialii]